MPRNFLLSWRLWLCFLAMVVVSFVLILAVDLNSGIGALLNMVIGAWLGPLACRADNEERLEAWERAHALWRARWDHAVRQGLGLEPDYGDRR